MASGDSYRPVYGARSRPANNDRNAPMYHFGAGTSENAPRELHPAPGEFSFRPRQRISERPLLQGRHNRITEISLPSLNGEAAKAKFQKLEDVTDSEGEEMDVSSEDDAESSTQKQEPVPKWTSAEIYTALPPPTESRKRKDVVKLIRKARLDHKSTDDLQSGLETNGDFISFGSDDFDHIMADDAPPNAPKGPRSGPSRAEPSRKRKRGEYLEQQESANTVNRRGKTAHKKGAVLPEWQPRKSQTATPWFVEDSAETKAGINHGLSALHREICDFYSWVKPRHFEQVMREDLVSRLHRCLQRIEPGSQLHAFGSFASGMYLPTGDMDLVLLTGPFLSAKARSRFPPPTRPINSYTTLIRKEGIAEPGSVQPIPKAKVPIIKFVDKITGLKVDLSFNNTTGIDANQTYQQWKARYPGMQQLVAAIKHYLMIRGLGDVSTGGLGGFSLSCLVVSLLQLKPLAQRSLSLGSNLIEFFNLYGKHFNRQKFGIRLDFPSYFEKSTYPPFTYNRDKPGRLAISDPNQPDNNISGGTHEIDLIFGCFSDAYEILTEGLEERNLKIGSMGSLLGDIIGGYYNAYYQQRDHLWDLFEKATTGSSSTHLQPPLPLDQHINFLPQNPPAKPKPSDNQAKQPESPAQPPKSKPVPSQRLQEEKALTSGPAQPTKPPYMDPDRVNSSVQPTTIFTPEMPPTSDSGQPSSASKISSSVILSTLLAKEKAANSQKITRAERRATRLRELRPDIPHVPKEINAKAALKLGGYQNHADMNNNLQALEKQKGNTKKP